MTLPQRAQTVIVGGGAVGCAVAYSLAEAGRKDILLLEKEDSLATQTTSQAAGLVGQVRSTVEEVKLLMWSAEPFERLQADSPESPAWRQVGSLRVAHCDERIEELNKLKAAADEAGRERQELEKKSDTERLANEAAQKLRQELEKKFHRASNSKKKFELAKAEIEAARLHAEYARREHKALNGK